MPRPAVFWSVATEVGVRGLEPLPLAYDLRNKHVRKRQNMVFATKNTNNFMGRGTAPSKSPDPSPSGDGDTPPHSPTPRRLRHLDPSHSKILGTPLILVAMLAAFMQLVELMHCCSSSNGFVIREYISTIVCDLLHSGAFCRRTMIKILQFTT